VITWCGVPGRRQGEASRLARSVSGLERQITKDKAGKSSDPRSLIMMSNLTGMAGILVRLGGDAQSWRVRLEKLRSGRLFGRFLTASRQKLRELASRLKVRRVVNLAGCPAR
jgi:hypothetical protein